MRGLRHVAHTGEKTNAYKTLLGKPKEIDHMEDQDINDRITLKLEFRNKVGWCELDSHGLLQGPLLDVWVHKMPENSQVGSDYYLQTLLHVIR
jgi:hypothetical protein